MQKKYGNISSLQLWVICVFILFSYPKSALTGLPETVSKVKASVVSVGTYQRLRAPPARFMGTGFVVADGMHVVTNAHVVPEKLNESRKETIAIFFRRGVKVEMRPAEVVAMDTEHDLALLKITGVPLSAMKLGDDKSVVEGKLYGFTGFPLGIVFGVTPVTHRGIVSAITPIAIPVNQARHLKGKHLQRLRNPFMVFQLDAVAYPGNSGSPLYETDTGKVIGVVNSVLVKDTKESALTSPTGISYAIPGRYIKRLIETSGLKY